MENSETVMECIEELGVNLSESKISALPLLVEEIKKIDDYYTNKKDLEYLYGCYMHELFFVLLEEHFLEQSKHGFFKLDYMDLAILEVMNNDLEKEIKFLD